MDMRLWISLAHLGRDDRLAFHIALGPWPSILAVVFHPLYGSALNQANGNFSCIERICCVVQWDKKPM